MEKMLRDKLPLGNMKESRRERQREQTRRAKVEAKKWKQKPKRLKLSPRATVITHGPIIRTMLYPIRASSDRITMRQVIFQT